MRIRTLITTLAAASTASTAGVTSFTEDFEGGANGWLAGSFDPPQEIASGALDGSAFIRNNTDLNSAGPFGLTVFRGQDGFDASGDAFVGDYIANGIDTVTFDFRHDAGQDLGIALRVATANNFPAFVVELADPVASSAWTTLSFDLDFFNPLLTIEGQPTPQAFEDIMRNVGNLQISSDRPDGLDTPLPVNFDVDNIAITPAPSSLAVLGLFGVAGTRRRR